MSALFELHEGRAPGERAVLVLSALLLMVASCHETSPGAGSDKSAIAADGGISAEGPPPELGLEDGAPAADQLTSTGMFWPPYADEGWPAIHHDPYGSDFTFAEAPWLDTFAVSRFDEPSVSYVFGSALDDQGQPTGKGGIALPVGATMDLRHGRAYAAVLKPGLARLVAFYTRAEAGHTIGEVAWTSDQAPGPGGERLDNCVGSSAALIDQEGNVYINGCRLFWSFSKEGQLRWTAPMPSPRSGEGHAVFISAVFTRQVQLPDGRALAGVGGVTTDGQVAFFDIADGRPLLAAPFTLPGVPILAAAGVPEENVLSECLWLDVEGVPMVDPEVVDKYVAGLFGTGMAIANTPAVLPDPQRPLTTRIYVPALLDSKSLFNGVLQNDEKLFRIDLTYRADGSAAVEEPASWRQPQADGSLPGVMPGGNGSATSPDISADGASVFTGDNNGRLFAFDAETGAQRWLLQPGKLMGSITTTWPVNEELYFYADGLLKKYTIGGKTPSAETEPDAVQDFQALAEALVPRNALFARVGMASGIAVTTPTRVYIPVTLGYQVLDAVSLAIWPMRSVLVVMDRDLRIINSFDLPDESELAGAPDEEGRFSVMFASMMSSLSHCLWRQGAGVKLGLPEPLRPSGGFVVFHE